MNSGQSGEARMAYYGEAKLATDLVAFPECNEYLLSNGSSLVRNPLTGGQAVLSSDALVILKFCPEFNTCEQHISQLASTIPELRSRRSLVEKVLLDAWQHGLLASGQNFIAALSGLDATPAAPLAAPVAAIISCERPAALQRLLLSMELNTAAGDCQQVFIIDDSNTPHARQLNQQAVAESRARSGLPLIYFGREQQAQLLRDLAAAVPHCNSQLRFMADGEKWRDYHSCGMSRNIALLLSVGRRLILLDDDVICEALDPPHVEQGVSFAAHGREGDFFAAADDWLSPFKRQHGRSPLAMHAEVLGGSLRAALARQHQPPELASLIGARPNLLSQLDLDAQVLSTACGTLGDPGTVTNNYLLGLSKLSRARLLASEATLESALAERRVWSGRSSLHIQANSNMSQILGIDNRRLLPPYFPVFRFEDTLFGYMLNYLHPSSPCLDLPWAVAHLPMPERRWEKAGISAGNPQLGVALFIDELQEESRRCQSVDEGIRLRCLAQFFGNLGAQTAAEVQRKYRDAWFKRVAAQLTQVNELLAEANASPPRWRIELELLADSLRDALGQKLDAVHFAGDPAWLSGDEQLEFWTHAWREYQNLLLAWPDIRQAAPAAVERWYE